MHRSVEFKSSIWPITPHPPKMNSVLLKFYSILFTVWLAALKTTTAAMFFMSTIWHQLSCWEGCFFLHLQKKCFVCGEKAEQAQQPAGHAFRASASAKHGRVIPKTSKRISSRPLMRGHKDRRNACRHVYKKAPKAAETDDSLLALGCI